MNTEDELIAKLKSPESREQGFRDLMSLYKERLYWHIRKMVYSHDDADDVLQNTFIKIYRNIEGFKGQSKLYSWMYRIATNEAISHINANARRMNISSEAVQEQAVRNLKADIYFDGDEIQLKLQEAIAKLLQKQQLVFNMKYFDDLKYKDMSEILDTSEGALKASYHLAVKKIESYLTKD